LQPCKDSATSKGLSIVSIDLGSSLTLRAKHVFTPRAATSRGYGTLTRAGVGMIRVSRTSASAQSDRNQVG